VTRLDSDPAFTNRSPLVRNAYEAAAAAHRGQVQDSDCRPYIEHTLTVARLVYEAGYDDEVVAAALLHDVVEHSGADVDGVRGRFGDGVADLVVALTEPAGIEPFEARKAAHRAQVAAAGRRAEAIFAADKVANASSLRRGIVLSGEPQVAERLSNELEAKVDHYRATLELLADMTTGPLTNQLRDELVRLDEDRAAGGDLELGRRGFEAFARRDAEALVALCTDDVEWVPALTLGANGEPYRGHDGVRAYMADLRASWPEFDLDLRDMGARDDRVLVLYRLRARGAQSGERIDQDAALGYEVRDGKVAAARVLLYAVDAVARRINAPSRAPRTAPSSGA
jgi:ketosteroid isomerase-like protein